MFSAQAPLAEVLAVVAEEAIVVLADPRPGSPDYFLAVELSVAGSNPESVSVSETHERNLLHRPAVDPMYEGAVMDDMVAADVDAVMGKTQTRCDEVRGQRGFLALGKPSIVPL